MSKTGHSKDSLGKAIVIQRTDVSHFDDSFCFLKEKFLAEMKKVEDEMDKFSEDLVAMYAQGTSSPTSGRAVTWEALNNSPLIEGDGEEKMLKLQFDLSQFDPAEIQVNVHNDILSISAAHEEKTPNSVINREFKREFLLPKGINTESVVSSISRDGVLIVQAPLPKLEAVEEIDNEPEKGKEKKGKVLSKNPQDVKPKKEREVKAPKRADMPKMTDDVKMASGAEQAPTPASPTTPHRSSKSKK